MAQVKHYYTGTGESHNKEELTKPGPVFTPNVDIFETEKEIVVLAEMIDQKKIDAVLNNGVLRLTLPKVEKAMPRQIAVKSG